MRFRADAGWREGAVALEGLVAIFHAPSGQTHLLAPPAPQLLAMLGQAPASADELLERLQAEHELEDGASAAVRARLAELEAAGLIAPA